MSDDLLLETVIRNHVQHVLAVTGENITLTARLLGISRSTLYNWVNRGCTPVELVDGELKDFSDWVIERPQIADLPPKIEPKPETKQEKIVCLNCHLVQFRRQAGAPNTCRRCHTPLAARRTA